mmetsp:Transcript_23037/g.34577  ORF Transcript_23037/g.34577 Transcript_23037/m.34577 type:complete len:183 (-) Transcript_23037:251-799(-)
MYQQQPTAIPQLPPGWEAAQDPVSGHTYYANRSTGETSWTPPPMPIFTPPPPPPIAMIQAPSMEPSSAMTALSTPSLNGSMIYSSNSILLVPSVMGMLQEEEQSRKSTSATTSLELEKLSAGKVADLCIVAAQSEDTIKLCSQYEVPLDPSMLPIDGRPPVVEQGRVEVRLCALYDALASIH